MQKASRLLQRIQWATSLVGLMVGLVFLVGCSTTLPDVKPFADITGELQSGIVEVGELTVARLKEGEALAQKLGKPKPKWSAEFQENWKNRVFAAQSMTTYSDSLAELVDAGNNSSAAAKELGDTVNGIAQLIPGGVGVASTSVVALGVQVADTLAKYKAAKSLDEAVTAGDPWIQDLADLLVDDLEDVENLYESSHEVIDDLRFENPGTEYSQHARVVFNAEQLVINVFAASVPAGRNIRVEELKKDAKKTQTDLADATKKLKDSQIILTDAERSDLRNNAIDMVSRLEEIQSELIEIVTHEADGILIAEEILANAQLAFKPYWEQHEAYLAEKNAFFDLTKQLRKTVLAWKKAHSDLAIAIENGRRPNLRALLAEAKKIHDLVLAIKEEHEKTEAPIMGQK